jgi:hypothetical protein
MFDDEKQEDGLKEQVVGLHKVTGPNPGGVIGQKGRPGLAMLLWWQPAPGLPHTMPDSSLVNPDAQLQ